jgi:hypothetical protein
MTRRGLLRNHLKAAWCHTIFGPYAEMLINSERGLQVHFCVKLLELLADHDRRLFIEPTIVFPKGVKRCPDLVICNSRRIIGVVEFKYTPRTLPSFAKDFETLALLAEAAEGEVALSNERFRGPREARSYHVASDAVLCWAAVHCDKPFSIPQHHVEEVGSRYLELRAIAGEHDVDVVPKCKRDT